MASKPHAGRGSAGSAPGQGRELSRVDTGSLPGPDSSQHSARDLKYQVEDALAATQNYKAVRALDSLFEQLEAQGRHLAVVLDEKLVTEAAFSELKEQLEVKDAMIVASEEHTQHWEKACSAWEQKHDALVEQLGAAIEVLRLVYREAFWTEADFEDGGMAWKVRSVLETASSSPTRESRIVRDERERQKLRARHGRSNPASEPKEDA